MIKSDLIIEDNNLIFKEERLIRITEIKDFEFSFSSRNYNRLKITSNTGTIQIFVIVSLLDFEKFLNEFKKQNNL